MSTSDDRAASTAEAVARILTCADFVVEAIMASAEREVRRIEAEAQARVIEEASRHRGQLEELLRRLPDGAAAPAEPPVDEDSDERVAAIRMTLRDRRRIHAVADVDDQPDAVDEEAGAVEDPRSAALAWRLWQRSAA